LGPEAAAGDAAFLEKRLTSGQFIEIGSGRGFPRTLVWKKCAFQKIENDFGK
jgi:hypothetical protein